MILGLFIYCQICWRRVRRKRRKRRQKKRERELCNARSADRTTTSLDHINGSTLHKPPYKYDGHKLNGSWTKYWKAVTRKDLPERCPCWHPGDRPILTEGRDVHGAHVLFRDRLGNYYGGIVPVSNIGNTRGYEIVHECDIVTVLNFGQMTSVGKLMTNPTKSVWMIPRETLYDEVPYEEERQFDSIKRVRSGEGEPRIIVEGLVGGFVNKKRIESTYTIYRDAANRYIYYLAQTLVQQTEELNYLSREHEPKIFKLLPPRPQPSIWRRFKMAVRGEIEDLTYLVWLIVWLILADLIRLVFGILLILLFVRFKPFSHKDSFPFLQLYFPSSVVKSRH